MLEHQKMVLQNLSHDKELFAKELRKSLTWLKSYEVFLLHTWVKEKYGNIHNDVIREIFALVAA